MLNVIDLITEDHREVEGLFQRIESGVESGDEEDVQGLVEQVADLLVAHSKAESAVVYPAIEEATDEDEEIKDSRAEHEHIEGMLQEIRAMEPGSPGFDGLLAALTAEVRHHVEEEEQEILPAFRESAGADRLEELGERFLAAKQEALGEGDTAGPGESEAGGRGAGEGSAGEGRSKEELYARAREQQVEGRSKMSKEELAEAVDEGR